MTDIDAEALATERARWRSQTEDLWKMLERTRRERDDLREFIATESEVTTGWREDNHNLHRRLAEEIARVTRAEASLEALRAELYMARGGSA